jgi:hypothetical protein
VPATACRESFGHQGKHIVFNPTVHKADTLRFLAGDLLAQERETIFMRKKAA